MQIIIVQRQTDCIHSYNIGQVNAKLSLPHFFKVPFIPRCKSNLFSAYIIMRGIVLYIANNVMENEIWPLDTVNGEID